MGYYRKNEARKIYMKSDRTIRNTKSNKISDLITKARKSKDAETSNIKNNKLSTTTNKSNILWLHWMWRRMRSKILQGM